MIAETDRPPAMGARVLCIRAIGTVCVIHHDGLKSIMRSRKQEDSYAKNGNSGELKTDRARTYLPPFACNKAVSAGRNDKKRHVSWPAENGSQRAEQRGPHAIEQVATKPEHAHQHREQPAEPHTVSAVSRGPTMLPQQMKTIEDIRNGSAGKEWGPNDIRAPDRVGSLLSRQIEKRSGKGDA